MIFPRSAARRIFPLLAGSLLSLPLGALTLELTDLPRAARPGTPLQMRVAVRDAAPGQALEVVVTCRMADGRVVSRTERALGSGDVPFTLPVPADAPGGLVDLEAAAAGVRSLARRVTLDAGDTETKEAGGPPAMRLRLLPPGAVREASPIGKLPPALLEHGVGPCVDGRALREVNRHFDQACTRSRTRLKVEGPWVDDDRLLFLASRRPNLREVAFGDAPRLTFEGIRRALRLCPHLETLRSTGTLLGMAEGVQLAAGIPTLVGLDLRDKGWIKDSQVAALPGRMRELRLRTLAGSALKDATLARFTHLEKLTLEKCRFVTGAALPAGLKELEVDGCYFFKPDLPRGLAKLKLKNVECALPPAGALPDLVELDLEGCSDISRASLEETVRSAPNLRRVRLERASPRVIQALPGELEALEVRASLVPDAEWMRFKRLKRLAVPQFEGDMCPPLPGTLTELEVTNCPSFPPGILRDLPLRRLVVLGGGAISEAELPATLEYLKLSRIPFTWENLDRLSRLRTLVLDFNGDRAWPAAPLLPPSLEELRVDNQILPAREALRPMLERLVNLRVLALSRLEPFAGEGTDPLCHWFPAHPSLRKVEYRLGSEQGTREWRSMPPR